MAVQNEGKTKPHKPSDFTEFSHVVYGASATEMEYPDYFDAYEELLKLLFWNPEIDTYLALEKNPNPSGTIFGDLHNG